MPTIREANKHNLHQKQIRDAYDAQRKGQRRRHAGHCPKGLTQDEWGEIYEMEASERRELTARIQATKAIKRREYKKNPFEIIRDGILSIKTKEYGIRPLDINQKYCQMKLLDYIEEEWFAKRPIRFITCKSRRQGISTLMEAILYVLVAMLIGINGLVVADDQEGSNYLTDIARLYHNKLKMYDPYITPDLERDNPKRMKFEKTESVLYIDTANDLNLGRKYTYHVVHLSEVAFYKISVDDMMLGLLQTISDRPYTMVAIESTSKGIGNYYHRTWVRAEQKISKYKAIFFSRYVDPDNRKPFDTPEEKKALMTSLDEEENEDYFALKRMYPSMDEVAERLNWRRHCESEQCGGNRDKFHQEYPKTPRESFLVSGRTRFSKKAMEAMETFAESMKGKWLKRGSFFNDNWEDAPDGDIIIWKKPVVGGEVINNRIQPQHKYVCAVDPMQGKLVAESTKETDWHSVKIFDVTSMEEVADIHCKGDQDLLGDKIIRLCRWYNLALYGIENNKGQALIQHAKRNNYGNLYMSTKYDERTKKTTKVIGWNKNKKSQILAEEDLASVIRDRVLIINDIFTVIELMTFVIDDEGKAAAQEGCNDDRVIACELAVLLCQHVYLNKEREIPPKEVYGTWEYYKAHMQELRDETQRKTGWLH